MSTSENEPAQLNLNLELLNRIAESQNAQIESFARIHRRLLHILFALLVLAVLLFFDIAEQRRERTQISHAIRDSIAKEFSSLRYADGQALQTTISTDRLASALAAALHHRPLQVEPTNNIFHLSEQGWRAFALLLTAVALAALSLRGPGFLPDRWKIFERGLTITMALVTLGFGIDQAIQSRRERPGLAATLRFEVASVSSGGVGKLFEAGRIHFVSGSSTRTIPPGLRTLACRARKRLADNGYDTAIVVGHHDIRPLRREVRLQFTSNQALAQSRADQVSLVLRDRESCPGVPGIPNILSLVAGPRKVGAASKTEFHTASDRTAVVFGLR